MSRRYDSRTTIFSPEGRLYQVEYAMEAISHAGTALGILSSGGIVLAAEKQVTSKLLENMSRLRPYGVSLLYAGWDEHHGYQLYHSDPSGNYSGWKATCIGSNATNATSILKQDYKQDCTLEEAKFLAIKVLIKSMDSVTLSSDKMEFAVLSRVNGKTVLHAFTEKEMDALLAAEKVHSAAAAPSTSS